MCQPMAIQSARWTLCHILLSRGIRKQAWFVNTPDPMIACNRNVCSRPKCLHCASGKLLSTAYSNDKNEQLFRLIHIIHEKSQSYKFFFVVSGNNVRETTERTKSWTTDKWQKDSAAWCIGHGSCPSWSKAGKACRASLPVKLMSTEFPIKEYICPETNSGTRMACCCSVHRLPMGRFRGMASACTKL